MEYEDFKTVYARPGEGPWGLYRESGAKTAKAKTGRTRRTERYVDDRPLHGLRKLGQGGLADLAYNIRGRATKPIKAIEQRVKERQEAGIGIGQGGLLRIGTGLALGAAFGYGGAWVYSNIAGGWGVAAGIGTALTGYGTAKWITSDMNDAQEAQFNRWFGAGAGLGGGYYYRGEIDRQVGKLREKAKEYVNYLDLAWTIVSPGGRALVELVMDPESVLTAPFRRLEP